MVGWVATFLLLVAVGTLAVTPARRWHIVAWSSGVLGATLCAFDLWPLPYGMLNAFAFLPLNLFGLHRTVLRWKE